MNLRTYIVPASVNDLLACAVKLVVMAMTSVPAAMEAMNGKVDCGWKNGGRYMGLCVPGGKESWPFLSLLSYLRKHVVLLSTEVQLSEVFCDKDKQNRDSFMAAVVVAMDSIVSHYSGPFIM